MARPRRELLPPAPHSPRFLSLRLRHQLRRRQAHIQDAPQPEIPDHRRLPVGPVCSGNLSFAHMETRKITGTLPTSRQPPDKLPPSLSTPPSFPSHATRGTMLAFTPAPP